MIGFSEYGWSFVGTDVDKQAIESAEKIVSANRNKMGKSIEFRLQNEPTDIFLGIIRNGDKFECSFCNPPFHANENEARASSNRKWIGLNRKKEITTTKVNSQEVRFFFYQKCNTFSSFSILFIYSNLAYSSDRFVSFHDLQFHHDG